MVERASGRWNPESAAGAGEDVGEALLEGEEGHLQPAVADGGKGDGDGEGNGVAEQVAPQAGVLDGGWCSR